MDPINANDVYVLDTSFLIDYFLRMLWTSRLNAFMRKETLKIIPAGVNAEFSRVLHELKGSSRDLSRRGYLLEDFFPGGNPFREIAIDKLFFDREDRRKTITPLSDRARALSYTDQTIVEAAWAYSKEGKSVFVASSDHGIVKTLEECRDRDNLEMRIISPWNMLTREDFSSLDVGLIITDKVFDGLLKADPGDNDQKYLVIAKGMLIGNGVQCGIAFDLYTRKAVYRSLPAVDGVYFVPMAIGDFGEGQKYGTYYLHFLTFAKYAVYDIASPGTIGIVEQKPLSHETLRRFIAQFKVRQITNEEMDRIFQEADMRYINWARVQDWHVDIYNRLVLGMLNHLRQELRNK